MNNFPHYISIIGAIITAYLVIITIIEYYIDAQLLWKTNGGDSYMQFKGTSTFSIINKYLLFLLAFKGIIQLIITITFLYEN